MKADSASGCREIEERIKEAELLKKPLQHHMRAAGQAGWRARGRIKRGAREIREGFEEGSGALSSQQGIVVVVAVMVMVAVATVAVVVVEASSLSPHRLLVANSWLFDCLASQLGNPRLFRLPAFHGVAEDTGSKRL